MRKSKRTEHCKIEMKIEKKEAIQYASELKLLLGCSHPEMVKDDFLKFNWDFWIMYFGGIAAKLEAVNSICKNPNIIISADCELLEEGKCLVFKTLTNLKQVIQTIKKRKE